MTEKNLQILKNLKSIKPDRGYAERSKMLILATPQNSREKVSYFNNFFELLRFSVALGLGSFLIIGLLGGISYINKNFSPLGLEGLNQKSLSVEAEDINHSIQITMEEIKYLDQTNQKVIRTMNEVSKNKPIYSNVSSTISADIESSSTEDISAFLIKDPALNLNNATGTIDEMLDKLAN
ncbi:MAG: hypothetical protein QMD50_02010 [Patescibacteria group bacterium]|nr:hypothetical protein [Patescibacteria group bacterium]